uniref:Uncharacterized protein n=1 Tax=Lotharella globosa TaxID=91324 RepID=A0A6V3JBN7_9EUKA|mmetsp:Transcript_11044/g.21326  ORF Transcript_11044/g.21326 Transcript_11044/m.21326 type:complete len:495 (+) Transcript_11044:65-1549(+)
MASTCKGCKGDATGRCVCQPEANAQAPESNAMMQTELPLAEPLSEFSNYFAPVLPSPNQLVSNRMIPTTPASGGTMSAAMAANSIKSICEAQRRLGAGADASASQPNPIASPEAAASHSSIVADRPQKFAMESTKRKELQVKLACGITLRNVEGKWKILCPYCGTTTVRFYRTPHEGCAKSKKEFRCHILEDKCMGMRIDQDLRSTLLVEKKKLTGKTYRNLTKDMLFKLNCDIPETLRGTLKELRKTNTYIERCVDEAYSHCVSAGLIQTSKPTKPIDAHSDKHPEDKKNVSPGTFLKVKYGGRCLIVGKISNFDTVSALRDKIALICHLGDSEFDVLFKDSSHDDVQITTNESLSYAYQSSVANDQHSKTFHVVHRPPDSKSSKRNRPSPMLEPIPQPEKEVEDVAEMLGQMQISTQTFVKALNENNKFRLGAVTSLIGAHIPAYGLSAKSWKDGLHFHKFLAPDRRLLHPERIRKENVSVSMIIISATRCS